MMDFFVGLLAGTVGAMGLGGGGLLLLYLSVFQKTEPLTARAVQLLFFLPTAGVALFFHRKNGLLEKSAAKTAIFWGIPGVLLGFFLSSLLPKNALRALFGLFLCFLGLRELFKKPSP